jgi:hypothetical protein
MRLHSVTGNVKILPPIENTFPGPPPPAFDIRRESPDQ